MDYKTLEQHTNESKTSSDIHDDGGIGYWDIILVLYCFLGIGVNILLVYTILHFRRLNSVMNMFIANWSLASALNYLLSPPVYALTLHSIHPSSYSLLCFIDSTEYFCLFVNFLFQTLVVIDWCIGNFWPNKERKWKHSYKLVIAAVWTPTFIGAVATAEMCYSEFYQYQGLIIVAVVLYVPVVTVFIVVINITNCIYKCKKKDTKSNYGLVIASINLLVTPAIFIMNNLFDSPWPLFVENSLPFLNAVLLYNLDDLFNVYLRKIFTCSLEDDQYRETLGEVYCDKCREQ